MYHPGHQFFNVMIARSIVLTVLFICSSNQLTFAQDTLVPEWVKIETSPTANLGADAWAIGSDAVGNLYWGVNKAMPFTFTDAFVYKMDDNSNIIWVDTAVTAPSAQKSFGLQVTDSLVYFVGKTCISAGNANCDALVFTTDAASGSTGWNYTWDGGFGYEEIDGIHLDPSGIIISGWSGGNGTAIDLLLMKLDYSGNLIWQTTWGSALLRDDHQDGHIVVDDSMIYVSGLYGGSPGSGYNGKSLLAKFDKTNGAFVDSLTYGRQDFWTNVENALGMTTDDTYLYVTGHTTVSQGNWQLFVAKFDKNLNEIWHKTWGGPDSLETARGISVTPDGSIYVGGTTKSYGNGGFEIVLLKYDPLGNLEWYKTYGGSRSDETFDIHIHGDDLYLTGKTSSFHPNQLEEAILIKVNIDPSVSIGEEILATGPEVQLFPNPATSSATLKWSNPQHLPHHLSIFDLQGQLVIERQDITGEELRIETGHLAKGLYIYQLYHEGNQIGRGKLMVE